jgi:transposase
VATLTERVIDTLEMSATALSRYAKEAASKKDAEKAASAAIPVVADTLVKFGWIDATEKSAAESALSDHAKTLELLRRHASAAKQAEVAPIGEQVDKRGWPTQKKASANDPYAGGYIGRRSSEDPPSWQAFAERLAS